MASVLAVFCGRELAVGAPQSAATFTSAIDLVPISAVVHDQRGRLVTTLTSSDFEVRDRGDPRPILGFQNDQTSAITLAVLLDMSGSMRHGPKLAFARQVMDHLSGELQEGRDEVGLFTFAAALHEHQPFSVHRQSMAAAFTGAEPFGATKLYDAIADTARRLAERRSARRAIIVLTDGLDTGSSMSAADVSALASSVAVPVYVVITVPPIDRPRDPRPVALRPAASSPDLRDLADWTGGALLWVSAAGEASAGAHQIVAELRQQYLIAIESSSEPDWRPLDVRVRDRRLTVRARSGYFSREGRPGR